jgi:hypothetical protein
MKRKQEKINILKHRILIIKKRFKNRMKGAQKVYVYI